MSELYYSESASSEASLSAPSLSPIKYRFSQSAHRKEIGDYTLVGESVNLLLLLEPVYGCCHASCPEPVINVYNRHTGGTAVEHAQQSTYAAE